eukprot:403351023
MQSQSQNIPDKSIMLPALSQFGNKFKLAVCNKMIQNFHLNRVLRLPEQVNKKLKNHVIRILYSSPSNKQRFLSLIIQLFYLSKYKYREREKAAKLQQTVIILTKSTMQKACAIYVITREDVQNLRSSAVIKMTPITQKAYVSPVIQFNIPRQEKEEELRRNKDKQKDKSEVKNLLNFKCCKFHKFLLF